MDIVRLRNNGDQTWQDQYGSAPFICPAGEAIIVPFDAVCLWFGDPRLSDRPTLSQYDRQDELTRVKARLGWSVLEAEGKDFPKLDTSVETIEGERVYMVIDDPDGSKSSLSSVNTAGLTDAQAVATELEQLKMQQQALLARLDDLSKGEQPSLDQVEEDLPTKIPVV